MSHARFTRLFVSRAPDHPRALDSLSDIERAQRERDADSRFVRALAIAISNGDHLPQAMRTAA